MSVTSLAITTVNVYSVSRTQNTYGAAYLNYTLLYANVPARIRYLEGREDFVDGKEQVNAIYRIYIPTQLNIYTSNLIVDNEANQYYDVLNVYDPANLKIGHMQIDVREVNEVIDLINFESTSTSSSGSSSSSYIELWSSSSSSDSTASSQSSLSSSTNSSSSQSESSSSSHSSASSLSSPSSLSSDSTSSSKSLSSSSSTGSSQSISSASSASSESTSSSTSSSSRSSKSSDSNSSRSSDSLSSDSESTKSSESHSSASTSSTESTSSSQSESSSTGSSISSESNSESHSSASTSSSESTLGNSSSSSDTSSSSSLYDHLWVSGDATPDAEGEYVYDGVYNGACSYKRLDGEWYIYFQPGTLWYISKVKGNRNPYSWRKSGYTSTCTDIFTGEFTSYTGTTGSLRVFDHSESSHSSTSSSKSSSSSYIPKWSSSSSNSTSSSNSSLSSSSYVDRWSSSSSSHSTSSSNSSLSSNSSSSSSKSSVSSESSSTSTSNSSSSSYIENWSSSSLSSLEYSSSSSGCELNITSAGYTMGGIYYPFSECYKVTSFSAPWNEVPMIWDNVTSTWIGYVTEVGYEGYWCSIKRADSPPSTWMCICYDNVNYPVGLASFSSFVNGVNGCGGINFGAPIGTVATCGERAWSSSSSDTSDSTSSSKSLSSSSESTSSSGSSSSSYIVNWSSSSIDSNSSSTDLDCPACMLDYECSVMPAMTNNSSPSPYVASDRDSTANAYKPFNRNKSDYLEFTDIGGAYFGIDFGAGNGKNVRHIAVTIDTAITAPTSLLVVGTNDLVNYDSIANLAYSDWTNNETKCWINIPNVNTHRYVQFSVSTAASTTARIAEIVMAEDHIMSSSSSRSNSSSSQSQ